MKKCCKNAKYVVLSPYKEEFLCIKCFMRTVKEVQLENYRQEASPMR